MKKKILHIDILLAQTETLLKDIKFWAAILCFTLATIIGTHHNILHQQPLITTISELILILLGLNFLYLMKNKILSITTTTLKKGK